MRHWQCLHSHMLIDNELLMMVMDMMNDDCDCDRDCHGDDDVIVMVVCCICDDIYAYSCYLYPICNMYTYS